ncbi:MAG: peptide deformylase [Acidimicrobiia bacterium]|nr:peptide deformylase [Acidimicrobiia bacterium]MDH4306128.1 peptide deformylase [Acidimicrobiia bacterium]
MTVRAITTIGNPVLRRPTRRVSQDELATGEVQGLIDDMIETMRDAAGAGIAATQVGSSLRITTIEVSSNRRYPYKPPIPLTVCVNPTWEPLDDEIVEINEGCLSVPLRGYLRRHVNIRVRYRDRHGTEHIETRHGLTAGTFQHEIDHLDGKLIVDRIDPRTLSTWDEYEIHERKRFEARITEFTKRT